MIILSYDCLSQMTNCSVHLWVGVLGELKSLFWRYLVILFSFMNGSQHHSCREA